MVRSEEDRWRRWREAQVKWKRRKTGGRWVTGCRSGGGGGGGRKDIADGGEGGGKGSGDGGEVEYVE